MEIKVDDKVIKHIKSKGDHTLTVELEVSDSCCVPASLPHVKIGAPQEVSKYDVLRYEDIIIYLYKGAVVKNVLKLSLQNYLLFKEIEVSGIQVI